MSDEESPVLEEVCTSATAQFNHDKIPLAGSNGAAELLTTQVIRGSGAIDDIFMEIRRKLIDRFDAVLTGNTCAIV